MMIKRLDVKPKIENLYIYATGVFPDPDLNTFALEFLNQVWRELYEQVFVQTKQIWEPIAVDVFNKIFGRVPFRRLMTKE